MPLTCRCNRFEIVQKVESESAKLVSEVIIFCYLFLVAEASWLVCSKSLDQVIRFQAAALARHIVLCSWARHFTLTVPFSTQVYEWVPATLLLGRLPCEELASHRGEGGGGWE